MIEPLFYARGKTIFQRPNKGQMGFPVCEASEYVDNAEDVIVDALNLVHRLSLENPDTGEMIGAGAEARRTMTDET